MDGTVILVEGESDKAALVAAAQVLDIELVGASVSVLGGATNALRFVTDAVAEGRCVAGLYDAAERAHVARALAAAGLTVGSDPDCLEDVGFFACVPDLEAELIAALGTARVLAVVEGQGQDARRLRSLQQMPEWRDQPLEAQLRRWFGSGGSRKVRYAGLLVAAMGPEEIPRPLRSVLDHLDLDLRAW